MQMTNRQQNIIYQLAVSETPLTADEIAKRIGASSRTVKTDMNNIYENIKNIGACIVAKRNEGYSISITDSKLFEPFFNQISVNMSLKYNFASNDMARCVYIARELVSLTKYIKINDIADELYISRSTLRDSIKDAGDFINRYDLEIVSKPGFGIRVSGMEHNIRMVLVELRTIPYHKAKIDNVGPEYSRWIKCDEVERQDIRHNFLRTLRSNELNLPDLWTQRLSIYLIVARNRFAAGFKLDFPKEWIKEIKNYEEYKLSCDIFNNLSKSFSGYDMPEDEIAFAAIMLLCYRDMGLTETTKKQFPDFYDDASEYAKEILSYVYKVYNIDLNKFDWVYDELKNMLIPVLARKHFELCGRKVFDLRIEDETVKNPLAFDIARTMAGYLQKRLWKDAAEYTTIYIFACFVNKILLYVSYDIKKLKLIIVHQDGINFGKITERKLLLYFSTLIESCTFVELYEIRGMDQSKYDAVITNTLGVSYNYDLPYYEIHTIMLNHEIEEIYNSILVYAYKFENLLPDDSIIHVYKDFDYISEKQFFQLISFKHCKNSAGQKRLEKYFIENENTASYRINEQSAIIFGRKDFTDDESVELYCLKKPGNWDGSKIKYILYVCLDLQNNLQKAKAIENSLCYLSIYPEYFEQFARDKSTIFKKMVYEYLKL